MGKMTTGFASRRAFATFPRQHGRTQLILVTIVGQKARVFSSPERGEHAWCFYGWACLGVYFAAALAFCGWPVLAGAFWGWALTCTRTRPLVCKWAMI